VVFENLGEADAGKLGSLIGVEDLRLAIAAEGFLEGLLLPSGLIRSNFPD
jgi:hypothetical protein